MPFDDRLYEYDRNNQFHEAAVRQGAYLYRLTSPTHCSIEHVLSGKGPLYSSEEGRFNAPQQITTYCANNVLVCLAEVLFHTYERAIRSIERRLDYAFIRRCLVAERFLVVLRIEEIPDLVHIDSEGVTVDFDARMRGAASVLPRATYKLFQDFHNSVRRRQKKGILYPSARHSRDVCFALFYDETARVITESYAAVPVTIRLIAENQDLAGNPRDFSPFTDKIHPTMGHYEFHDPAQLMDLVSKGEINPPDLPVSGMLDFVRRPYRSYPGGAVCRIA